MAHIFYAYAKHMNGTTEITSLKWVETAKNLEYLCTKGGFSKPTAELDENELLHLNEFIAGGMLLQDISNLPTSSIEINNL